MASRRRSGEDKNTKLLRELAAIPANKQCFDCLQRGPTYINVTIGSFVCTTCSGILRGLTPPHRVKSISMTTFTPEEIEFLKSRGNEYCKYVWLGTFDTQSNSIENEVSDDQRKRDFMVQKYEKKRWYVDPEIAVKKLQNDVQQRQKQGISVSQPQSFVTKSNTLPATQPLSRLLGKSPTPLVVHNNQQPTETWPHPVSSASAPTISTKTTAPSTVLPSNHSFDLISEFSDSSTSAQNKSATNTSTANGNFANFANFDNAFNTTEKSGWTSFDDDLDPLSSSTSRCLTISKDSSFFRIPRPLSFPTFASTNPFKCVANSSGPTPTQWPSFAAPGMPTSASLDAYPKPIQKNPVSFFSPTTSSLQTVPTSTPDQGSSDRYAALAQLDSLFNQPPAGPTKVSNWAVEPTNAATELSVINERSNYSTAPSNPFASNDIWSHQPPATVQNSFQAVNPFQAATDNNLSYTHSATNQGFTPFSVPLVGNSPSDDTVRNQFNANFSGFPTQMVTSPTNGYAFNSMMLQNGGIAFPTSGTAPCNAPMWNSSQGGLFANENKMVDTAQHSDWIQNPVNPFMAPSNTMEYPAPTRNNCSNPFL